MTNKKTLAVIFEKGYNPAVQLITSLIETKDDINSGEIKKIIGVEDGTVQVMQMEEKKYFDNKMSMSSSQKKLFIGDIKEETRSLEMIMTILYDEHGIKIGKSGNSLLITTSVKPLLLHNHYNAFIEEFKEISNCPITKENFKLGLNLKTIAKMLSAPLVAIPGIGPWAAGAGGAALGKDAYDDLSLIKNQQMLFAVFKLYYNFLDSFMKA